MELTKEELQKIIVEAIHEDRNERDKQVANQIIDSNDIESPLYNTNKLFVELQREFKARYAAVEEKTSSQFSFAKWEVERKIRELVFAAFNAKNSRYIEVGHRQEARDLYEALTNIWLLSFVNTNIPN